MFLPSRRASTRSSARSRASCCDTAGCRNLSVCSISETDFSPSTRRHRIIRRASCESALRNSLASWAFATSVSRSSSASAGFVRRSAVARPLMRLLFACQFFRTKSFVRRRRSAIERLVARLRRRSRRQSFQQTPEKVLPGIPFDAADLAIAIDQDESGGEADRARELELAPGSRSRSTCRIGVRRPTSVLA